MTHENDEGCTKYDYSLKFYAIVEKLKLEAFVMFCISR